MLEYERELWEQGKLYIAGMDEVGRGCLFGDVVAAAVILPQGLVLEDVNDSKQISEKKREALYEIIMEKALAVGVGIVDVATIERINIKQAARLAMKEAVEKLNLTPDMLLVDAEKVDVPIEQLAIIHGDARSQSIAAASIIAKVTRDGCASNGMWNIRSTGSLYIKVMQPKSTGRPFRSTDLHRCIERRFLKRSFMSSSCCFSERTGVFFRYKQ